ncbi:MAG: protein TolR [Mariprofundaceae bacterium]
MGDHNRWNQHSKPMGEINVTPLVDVMLVLLIIFMITAPLMTQGVKVDLPDTDAPAITQNTEPLIISIKKNGDIYLQKQRVKLEEIAPRIAAIKKQKPDLPVFIRGDAKTAYEHIAQVMGVLAAASIQKVGLVTEPTR